MFHEIHPAADAAETMTAVEAKAAAIKSELAALAERNNGVVRPADVVEFAKDPRTALHSKFEWDDTEAAQNYRLWQARQVLRVHVEIIEGSKNPVRVFSRIYQESGEDDGYRFTVQVMNDPERRAMLVDQVRKELGRLRRKYSDLVELAKVWSAIDEVTE